MSNEGEGKPTLPPQRETSGALIVSTSAGLLGALMSFASAPLLAQALGVEGRGEVSAATAPVILAAAVVTLGLPEAALYFAAKYPQEASRIVWRSNLVAVGIGAILNALLFFLAPILVGTAEKVAPLLQLASFASVPSLILLIMRGFAIGRGHWKLYAAETTTGSLLRLVLVLALMATKTLTPLSATIVIALTNFAGGLVYIALWWSRRDFRDTRPAPRKLRLIRYGLGAWLGAAAGMLLANLDQSLMTPLSSTEELGFYATAVSVANAVLIFNTAVRNVAFAAQSRTPDPERLTKMSRQSTVVTFLTALVIGIASYWLVPLMFGPAFSASVPVLWCLLLAIVLGNPGSVAGVGLNARGMPIGRSASVALAAVANVVAVIFLVPHFGAMGAAWATVVGNVIAGLGNIILLRWRYHIPVSDFLMIRVTDITEGSKRALEGLIHRA